MHKGQREKSAVVEQGVNLEDTYIFRQGAEISILRTAAAEGREGVNSDTPGDSVASRAIVGTIECELSEHYCQSPGCSRRHGH